MKYSLAAHGSIATVIGVGDVINDPEKENSKLRAYFRFDDLSGTSTFGSEVLPLKYLKMLIPGTPYNFKKSLPKSGYAWVHVDPKKITSHSNVLPQDAKYIVRRLDEQHKLTKAHPSAQREHAYFLHENHLKIELDLYTLIIPCTAIVQYFFCVSTRIASIILTPKFGISLAQYKTVREHRPSAGTSLNFDATVFGEALSNPSFRVAAQLPYKHILMTAIENLKRKTSTPLSIITLFPKESPTSLLIKYQAYEKGIKDHFKKRIVVVEQIHHCYDTERWPFLFKKHPTLLTPKWVERQEN